MPGGIRLQCFETVEIYSEQARPRVSLRVHRPEEFPTVLIFQREPAGYRRPGGQTEKSDEYVRRGARDKLTRFVLDAVSVNNNTTANAEISAGRAPPYGNHSRLLLLNCFAVRHYIYIRPFSLGYCAREINLTGAVCATRYCDKRVV